MKSRACRYCGICIAGKHPVCRGCRAEIETPGGKRRYPRARVASELVGLRGWHPGADRLIGFRWFHETPGARPSLDRWEYLDWPTLCARARTAFPRCAFIKEMTVDDRR